MPQSFKCASLEANAQGVWFAASITGNSGNTGNVAAVPEPSEWAMLVAGLAVVGFIARRRSQTGRSAAA
jgi:hypothetical protein